MAVENYSAATEVDEGSDITITSTKAAYDTMDRDVTSYVYWDKEAEHFSGDYEHLVEIYQGADEGLGKVFVWGLANLINNLRGIDDAGGDYHSVMFYSDASYIYLEECVAGSISSDLFNGALETLYYIKVKRDEAVGDNGTSYCYIYDDAGRTNLVDTLSLTLGEKENFRYIYALSSYNYGLGGAAQTGYSQNLDLQEAEGQHVSEKTNHYRKMRAA